MIARLYQGDCVTVMHRLDPGSADALVCDPPYEIGFLGKGWDKSGIAFQPATWAAAFDVLKPGGHLLAFGATRTYHRMAVAIEDAGFEVRDSLNWVYGSGFAKSRDVAELIDNELGVARTVVGEAEGWDTSVTRPGFSGAAHSKVPKARKVYEVTEATSSEAKNWAGWGTALKPAHEPIVLARKPIESTIAANVLSYRTGALNIGETRIGETGGISHGSESGIGRWPSNFLVGHDPSCAGSGANHTEALCVSGCPVAAINDASPGAASFYYIAKPRTRERIGGTMRNLHPTVKPIELMRYLVRMVTPPSGLVLDPFLGSGTTGCAAILEGFNFIGIELEKSSFAVAAERISDYAFASGYPRPECLV